MTTHTFFDWLPAQHRRPMLQRLLIVCSVMVLFAFGSNFVYALMGSLLRDWLAQGRRLLVFNRVLSAVLVATALWMLSV